MALPIVWLAMIATEGIFYPKGPFPGPISGLSIWHLIPRNGIPDVRLPKDYATRDPDLFPYPDTFDTERFDDEGNLGNSGAESIPFGLGRRSTPYFSVSSKITPAHPLVRARRTFL